MTKKGQDLTSPSGRRRRPLLVFVGTRIRQLREERGWNQREFAAEIGVSASLLAKYESGDTEAPLRTLLRIAHALGVSVGLLADERHGMEPIGDAAILARVRRISGLGEPEKQAFLAILDIFIGLSRLTGKGGAAGGAR
jgi:transcriptional regulator with XRE-family HTH domain